MIPVKTISLLLFFAVSINLSGQDISDFSLINAVDQTTITLSSFNSSKAIAIIFTSNDCPYAKLYEKRLLDLYTKYADSGLTIMLINPNNPKSSPEDDMSKMKDHARKMNYPFPYLVDLNQKVSKLFGAKKTPEAFLLKPERGVFSVLYKGSIDDNPQNSSDVGNSYLSSAVEMAVNGQQVHLTKSRPVGCMIKT